MRGRLRGWGPPQLVGGLGAAVVMIGAAVMCGWIFGVEPLAKNVFGSMKPNTALSVTLLGTALILLRKGDHATKPARRVAYTIASLTLLIGVSTLLQFLLGSSFGIDGAWIAEHFSNAQNVVVRMAPLTAMAITFLSLGILTSHLKTQQRNITLSQVLAFAAALLGGIAFVGYIYGVSELYTLGWRSRIALHTATALMLGAIALVFLQADRGIMRLWRSDSAGGRFTRRLVPPVIVLPVLFGWLARIGEQAGLYETQLAHALFAIASVTSLTALVAWAAMSLEKFEANYRDLYDNAPDLYASLDNQGRIVECNKALTRALGYSRRELLGRGVLELYAKESTNDILRVSEAYMRSGRVENAELILQRADGGKINVTLNVIATYDSDQKIIGSRVAWRDITTRKRLEDVERRAGEEAQRQLAIQRAILESIGDAVIVADKNDEVAQWNSAAELIVKARRMMGPPSTWTGEWGTYAADKTTRILADQLPVPRAIRGELVTGMEVFFRSPLNPEGVFLSVTARPLLSGEGAVAIFRDITAQKAAQEQLMVTDRMVSMGMLAAGVAHEINNPLAAVIANLDLSMSMIGHERPDLVDQMHDAREGAERVRTIARDLKVFSRIEGDKRELVELERVLESSLRMAWNEIRHRAQLKKDYRATPKVDANESRLGQVFLNLIVNAAQAIGEGHSDKNEIRVATRTHADGRAIVEISDTGSGMSADVKQRLFTPFFTTKPSGFGSGLGLAICQRIVNGLGGVIEVESEVGKGSTFRVIFPAAASDVPARSVSAEMRAVQLAPKRRGRVLVVDDEAAIGSTIRRVLSQEHDVLTLTSAEEALERIRGGARFDVIICDLMMPVMTGQELFVEISRIASELAERMVFLTGGAFTETARSFLDAVANETLEKPFDAETIRSVVRERVRTAS